MGDSLEILLSNPRLIGHEVGFADLTPIHDGWIRGIVFGEEDYTLQAHRGSFKSSCMAVAIALLMILFPDRNIIFLRKADNDVAEMMGMVAKILRSWILQDLARALHEQPLSIVEESQNHIFALNTKRPEIDAGND